ncbi:MAG: hypothetical protein WKF82_10810 [Nocardioidaceae bacterium]
MKIRFVLLDAYSGDGTVRAVFNLAGALANRHQVESPASSAVSMHLRWTLHVACSEFR